MARLRYNACAAVLDQDLTDTATTIELLAKLTHAAGDIPTITAPDYLPLSILGESGLAVEIVHLTDYTTGGLSGTIVRAQEGTTAAAHGSGSVVVHAPTIADWVDSSDFADATHDHTGDYEPDGAVTTHLSGAPHVALSSSTPLEMGTAAAGTATESARGDHRHPNTAPIPTAAGNVPRLARAPVASTGDLGLPGFAGSDTGWRDLTLANGWTGSLRVRRTGYTVQVVVAVLNGAAATSDTVAAYPPGFARYPSATRYNFIDQSGSPIRFGLAGSGYYCLRTSATSASGDVTYPTNDAWPTSLPGSQVTAPATWS